MHRAIITDTLGFQNEQKQRFVLAGKQKQHEITKVTLCTPES